MAHINEDIVEQAALGWLGEMGYQVVAGGDIAPGEPGAERASYDDVLLHGRLRRALTRINEHIPAAAWETAVDEAIRRSARARIRVLVKRILKKHGYPPDMQESATATVLEQAERLAADWVG